MSKTPYKQVIVLRKDLNMRKGKMVAQGAHASLAALLLGAVRQEDGKGAGTVTLHLDVGTWGWLSDRFTKVCVAAQDLDELLALRDRAAEHGLRHCLIQDAGLTEFGGVPTYTALAVGPDVSDRVDTITGNLPLL